MNPPSLPPPPPPQSIKGSLLLTLHSLGSDTISSSSRLEWLPLLHNAALLFATLRARGTIYQHSWSSSFQPGHAHMLVSEATPTCWLVGAHPHSGNGHTVHVLQCCVHRTHSKPRPLQDVMGYLQRMFRESEAAGGGAKPIPWSGIRYMMAQVSHMIPILTHYILT